MKIKIFFILFINLIFLFSCSKSEKKVTDSTAKIQVVTTLFPVYDFVQNIAGKKVHVTLLSHIGGQTHSFEPSPKDIKRIEDATLFIFTGGESDAWVYRTLEAIKKNENRTVIRLFDFVDLLSLSHESDDKYSSDYHLYDEHVWTSLLNVQKIVSIIAQNLEKIDPSNSFFYEQAARQYKSKILELHNDFRLLIENAPQKILAIADRFPLRYFAHDYGLEYIAFFDSCSTQTEPSAALITDFIKKIQNERIPVIFHMEFSDDSIAQLIVRETDAKVMTLNACHTVSKADFNDGVSYLDLMQQNYKNLKDALY
ncbi:MAG: metal ABC transporter substrate-binding protein [Treponemataceae bacterium]